MSTGVDLDLAAHEQRVVVAHDRAQLVTGEANLLVDLVVGSQEGETLAGDRLGDEDPHAPTSMPLVTPSDSRPARCAAATPLPGRPAGRPPPGPPR